MNYFTADNTNGYSAAQLADLNAAYNVRLSELHFQGFDVDSNYSKSLRDNVAENVFLRFDSEDA